MDVVFFTGFNMDPDAWSFVHAHPGGGVSATKQSFAEECDINNIVARFNLSGQLPEGGIRPPLYEDFTQAMDYRECLDVVIRGQQEFGKLPAELRARFGNDPGVFLDFVEDPANASELVKYGLASTRVEPAAAVPPAAQSSS